MTIEESAKRMNEVVNGLDNEVSIILNDLEPDIVLMQQKRLEKGLFVNEKEIFPDYTEFTVLEKIRKGQDPDHVTLRDTGDFYSGIYAAQIGDEVIIESSDSKSSELTEKYSEGIFGLTKNNKLDLQQKSTEMLINYVKRITGF